MSSSENVESLARRCIKLFNKKSLEWVDGCYAENLEWLELPLPASSSSRHGDRTFLRNTAARLLSLFPDRQMTIHNLVPKENRVAMELEWRGTAGASVGAFKIGTLFRYRIASFIAYRDGLIINQTAYCVPTLSGAR